MNTSNQSTLVEKFCQQTIQDIDQKIAQIITDEKILSILKNGKRLRPILAILVFKACTNDYEDSQQYQRILEAMVCIELAHNASLVHDDIMDKEKIRRGEPAFYRREGIGNALLIGHKMLAIGFEVLLSHEAEIVQLYVDTWRRMLDGQILEINFNDGHRDEVHKTYPSQSTLFRIYDEIIDRKTATLFAMACRAAAIKAHVSKELVQFLTEYGREIGLAYQLADDLVDLEKGEMIKSVLLPLLLKVDKKFSDTLFDKSKLLKKKMKAHASEIKQLYLEEIRQHIMRAKELSSLESIPNGLYKDLLLEAPSHIINNMLKEINVTI